MQEYTVSYLPAPLGSFNTGAICWLNSLMQSLISCPIFVKTVLESKKKLLQNEPGSMLYDIIWCSINNYKKFPYTVSNLQKSIVTAKKTFGRGQECASEGLVHLLELVQNNEYFLSCLFTHRFRCDLLCMNCKTSTPNGVDYGVSINLFQLNNPITTTEEFVSNLKVHISKTDKQCSKCNETLLRRYRLTMIPEILIIMFNKYDMPGQPRLQHYVPTEFSLTSTDGKQMNFIQVAQIEHHGTRHGGHYFAKCLRRGGVYLLNDASSSVDEFKPTSNTYIVIYNFRKYN